MEEARALTTAPVSVNARWLKVFLFLTATLASTILLKIGPVQILELLYFLQLAILLVVFFENGYKLRLFRPYGRIAIWYLIFSLAALLLAISALRYEFYLPAVLNVLNYPIVITLSRIVELLASVAIMLYLATKFREDQGKVAFTMKVYFWVGFTSAVFAIASYPLSLIAGIDLGAYGNLHRMRGFYNEGGPYGIYLISLFLVGFALRKQGWLKQGAQRLAFTVLGIAFLGSRSKAAWSATLVMILINGLLAKSLAKRVIHIAALALVLIVVHQVVDLSAALRLYRRESTAYERLSHRRSKDGNFVYGRVAGAFIVPRMVAVHPLAGIGWGNYGLVRNAPEYRGASAFVSLNDDPGLGIAGMAAELGLPLVCYLGVCLVLPFLYLRRLKSPLYLTNLALLQPIAHLFGGQLNLTYPWVVSAFALGLAYSLQKQPENIPQRTAS